MDALETLLHGVRSDGALFGRTIMSPPWAVRFAERAPLTLVTMLRGDGWVVPDGAEAVRIGPRDVAVVVGPGPFSVTDDIGQATRPLYVIHGPDHCTTSDGVDIGDEMTLGPRTCGAALGGPTALLTGTYRVRGRVSERLMTALPRVLVVREEGRPWQVLDLTVAEISRDTPGQQAVLDRLLDLLLLTTVREWFDQHDTCAPGWYSALSDPTVGSALRRLHHEPAHPWSVEALAGHAGVSRATFSRRFHDLLGEPPMRYLTGWRLALAADLLHRSDATVDVVARQVGYANAYALSVAFKRRYGTRPSEHRASRTRDVPLGA